MQYILRLLLIVCLPLGFALPGGFLVASAQGISNDQKRANFWYFGQYAGLDFNSGSAVAVTDGALATGEGCSVISDQEGDLLFYTDGVTVWNRLHQPMPNGTGLWGSNYSTQSEKRGKTTSERKAIPGRPLFLAGHLFRGGYLQTVGYKTLMAA